MLINRRFEIQRRYNGNYIALFSFELTAVRLQSWYATNFVICSYVSVF